jgi:hypothetical protein
MGCTDTTTIIGVKIFVEKDVVAEIDVVVHLWVTVVTCSFPLFIAEEDVHETLYEVRNGREGGHVL